MSGAGGRTADPVLGDVFGSRSIKFRHEVNTVADLKYLSGVVYQRANDDRYKQRLGWADNIAPVEDEELESELRDALLGLLQATPMPASVDALIPDDLVNYDDDRSLHYIAYPRERRTSATRTTLTPEMLARLVGSLQAGGASASPLDAELRFLDAGHEHIGSASILECLCADISVGGERYIAYDGAFFVVANDFVEAIDDELTRLPACDLPLPCFGGGTEPDYADKIRREHADSFAVVDRAYIRVPSETDVEACDLVARSGALVHLKRKGKSQVLSHLFLQAANSCALLRGYEDARSQLDFLVKASGANSAVREAATERLKALEPGQSGVEIVFGFLGDWRNRDARSLPLLSKISLVNTARRIHLLGCQPTVALIGLCL